MKRKLLALSLLPFFVVQLALSMGSAAQILLCTDLPEGAILLSKLPKNTANHLRNSGAKLYQCNDSKTKELADFIYTP